MRTDDYDTRAVAAGTAASALAVPIIGLLPAEGWMLAAVGPFALGPLVAGFVTGALTRSFDVFVDGVVAGVAAPPVQVVVWAAFAAAAGARGTLLFVGVSRMALFACLFVFPLGVVLGLVGAGTGSWAVDSLHLDRLTGLVSSSS